MKLLRARSGFLGSIRWGSIHWGSINWSLPVSYAAVSAIAAVALGAVLMITLAGYYRNQEKDYLRTNGLTIASNASTLIGTGLPLETIESQLLSLAFLTQTRLRYINQFGMVLVDTGDPRELGDTATISLGLSSEGFSQEFSQAVEDSVTTRGYQSVIEVGGRQSTVRVSESIRVSGPDGLDLTDDVLSEVSDLVTGDLGDSTLVSAVPGSGGQFGFDLGPGDPGGPRSNQVAIVPLIGPSGDLGTIELSMGPAVGSEVLTTVAWGWAISGAVAVLLAATAGWWVSRRLASSIVGLSDATSRMAGGDLSVRASVSRRDEIGELGDQFNLMAGRLEETVSTLKTFVADAAHELNTPLTSLKADLELARREIDQAGQGPGEAGRVSALVARASGQIARLESISSGLLDLSRIEAAGQEAVGAVDMADIIKTIEVDFASRADQAGPTLRTSIDSGQPVTVLGRASELRMAVSNLVDNAIKFTPSDGSIDIELRLDGDDAVITVSDTGIGVPSADMPNAFLRFSRGRNTAALPGSGLGLAIVKAVAEGHDGEVSLESRAPSPASAPSPGSTGGTRVTLRLPRRLPRDWQSP
jgi:signal transduction histidine kinase